MTLDSFYFLITAVLTLVLVITGFYYSIQSKKQLENSLEETKTELDMASRPLLVIRAVVYEAATTYEVNVVSAPKGAEHVHFYPVTSHFSHFELFNAGNSPAIDLEISLMDGDGRILQGESLGFLRNNEQALTFVPINLELQKDYRLVCEYESIRNRVKQIWYQTWLPFTTKAGPTKGTINVDVGELEFKDVPMSERIEASKTKKKLI